MVAKPALPSMRLPATMASNLRRYSVVKSSVLSPLPSTAFTFAASACVKEACETYSSAMGLPAMRSSEATSTQLRALSVRPPKSLCRLKCTDSPFP